MFVCNCSPLTEEQVTEAIKKGARTTDQIFERWDSAENCGKCTFQMREMIDAFHPPKVVLPMAPTDPTNDD